jgi:hypothetical protein
MGIFASLTETQEYLGLVVPAESSSVMKTSPFLKKLTESVVYWSAQISTGRVYELDGFERLRSVIDLRDQTIQFDISNRTKDGILITIKGIRIIFLSCDPNQAAGQSHPVKLVPRMLHRKLLTPMMKRLSVIGH